MKVGNIKLKTSNVRKLNLKHPYISKLKAVQNVQFYTKYD